MPNNLDSVIANDAIQQTSAPPCTPRLFICFLEPLQLPTKRLVIKLIIITIITITIIIIIITLIIIIIIIIINH